MKQRDIYTGIRWTGMVLFIPLMLATGPAAGYLIGDFLVKKWGWPFSAFVICIVVASLGAAFEVYRIIRLLQKEIK